LNIAEQPELPTRAEWETLHSGGSKTHEDAATFSGTASDAQMPIDTSTSLKPADGARSVHPFSGLETFYRKQPKGGRIALVLSTLVAVVVIVVVALGSGGPQPNALGEDPTHCDSLCGDNAFGQPSKWPNGSAVTVACSDVNAGTTQNTFMQESIDAAQRYCGHNLGASVNIELSGP
jgi:hypothetical protein